MAVDLKTSQKSAVAGCRREPPDTHFVSALSPRLPAACKDCTLPIGLLTPIGRMHLDAAASGDMTSVVFGTNAWQVLAQFTQMAGPGAPVLFYVAYDRAAREAAWKAAFVEYRDSRGGFPPREWHQYREAVAAEEDKGLGPGYFAGYYLVEELAPLQPPTPLRELYSWTSKKRLAKSFLPIGPIIVEW